MIMENSAADRKANMFFLRKRNGAVTRSKKTNLGKARGVAHAVFQ
jgi:hypothetical protein